MDNELESRMVTLPTSTKSSHPSFREVGQGLSFETRSNIFTRRALPRLTEGRKKGRCECRQTASSSAATRARCIVAFSCCGVAGKTRTACHCLSNAIDRPCCSELDRLPIGWVRGVCSSMWTTSGRGHEAGRLGAAKRRSGEQAVHRNARNGSPAAARVIEAPTA